MRRVAIVATAPSPSCGIVATARRRRYGRDGLVPSATMVVLQLPAIRDTNGVSVVGGQVLQYEMRR